MRDPIRHRRRVLILLGILAGLIILSFVGRWYFERYEEFVPPAVPVRQDSAWIEQASMRGLTQADQHYGGARWGSGVQLLLGHRIGPGECTVLAWRAYYDASPAFDDEGFEFLTIEIRGPASNRAFQLPSPDVRVFYSRGSSTWGLGEYSALVTGEIHVGHLSTAFATPVRVHLEIRPWDPHKGGEVHDMIRLEKRLNLMRLPLGDLFPWLRGTSSAPSGRDMTEGR